MVVMMPVMTVVMIMRRVSGLLVTMAVRAAAFLLGGGGSAFCRRMLVLVVHTSADGAAPKGLHFFRNKIDAMPPGHLSKRCKMAFIWAISRAWLAAICSHSFLISGSWMEDSLHIKIAPE